MAVRSRSGSSFIHANRRYKTLQEAEFKMRSITPTASLLKLKESTNEGLSKIIYSYDMPLEPHISAGKDKYLICGNIGTLVSNITGVPLNQLNLEWELLHGNAVSIDDPDSATTTFQRAHDDSQDKTFALTVTNSETGISNFDTTVVFGTPTDWTYVSGGMYTVSYYEDPLSGEDWRSINLSEAPKPGPSQPESQVVETRGFLIENPQFPENLVGIQIFEREEIEFLPGAIFPPSTRYIPVSSINVRAAKIRFLYNFGSVKSYIESPPSQYRQETTIYIQDAVKYSRFNNSVSISSQSQRLETSEQSEIDFAPFGISEGMNVDFLTDTLRKTRKVVDAPNDPFDFGQGHGTLSFITDTLRIGRGQIGGG